MRRPAGAGARERHARGRRRRELSPARSGPARIAQVGCDPAEPGRAPRTRRKGCYKELIERAREVAGQRGASMLLAFATNDPSSQEALERASFAETRRGTWPVRPRGGRPTLARHAPAKAAVRLVSPQPRRRGHRLPAPRGVPGAGAPQRIPLTRVAEAPGGLWGILGAESAGGGVQAVISEELLPIPPSVATALKVWGLPVLHHRPCGGQEDHPRTRLPVRDDGERAGATTVAGALVTAPHGPGLTP